MSKRNKILELRNEGKSYREIEKILGCSRSVIAYHCEPRIREKSAARTREFRKNNVLLTKIRRFKRQKNRQGQIVGGGSFSYDDAMRKIQDQKCYLTGRFVDFSQAKSYHLDHIVPVSKGGQRNIDNLGLTCKEANQAKGDLMLDEFIDLCKDVLVNHGYAVTLMGR